MSPHSPEPRWLNQEEQQFWRLLIKAKVKLDRALDHTLQQSEGLSSTEFAVLVTLSEAPEHSLRLKDLCCTLDWDRSRASHQITRMQRRGFVEKLKCDGDARGVVVSLCDEGLRRLEQAAPDHVEVVRRIVFDDLDQNDLPAIIRFLEQVAHNSHDDALQAGCKER